MLIVQICVFWESQVKGNNYSAWHPALVLPHTVNKI